MVATALCVAAWGYFLYQGVTDPLGGINTLWPLFGISNQMLAAVALTLCTVVIFKMKRERYAWVTIVPTIWLLVCTLTAGWQKIFSPIPASASWPMPAATPRPSAAARCWRRRRRMEQMRQIVFNDRIDAALAALFIGVVVAILVFGIRSCLGPGAPSAGPRWRSATPCRVAAE